MQKLRVGLIGCGVISDRYLQCLEQFDIVDVVACGSLDEEESKRKAKQYNISKVATPEAIIADPNIDCILNLTIPAAHAEIAMAALQAGKHVYSEKPLVTHLDDGKKMLQLAKQHNLRVGNAPDTFLGGRLQTVKRLLDEGVIGQPTGVSAFVCTHGVEAYHPNPDFYYQHGGGPLFDLGPYYLTAMVALFGAIETVAGMAKKTFAKRTIGSQPRCGDEINVTVDTHINSLLQFESGVQGTLFSSFDVWDSKLPRLEIYGTEGTLCIDEPDPTDGANIFGGQVLYKTAKDARWSQRPRQLCREHWHLAENKHAFNTDFRGLGLVDMAYAIVKQRPHRANGDMALHVVEVMDAIIKSSSQGRFVMINSRCKSPQPLPVDFPMSELL